MSRRAGPNSDRQIQDRLRSRERTAEMLRREDLKAVMDLPAGRRFVYDLIFGKCGVMAVYPGQDSGIYRHEGRRSLGIEVAAELQQDMPERYVQMINERLIEAAQVQKEKDAALASPGDENDG